MHDAGYRCHAGVRVFPPYAPFAFSTSHFPQLVPAVPCQCITGAHNDDCLHRAGWLADLLGQVRKICPAIPQANAQTPCKNPCPIDRKPSFRLVNEMISTGVALLAILGSAAAFSIPPPTSGIWTTRQKALKNAQVLPLTPKTAESLSPWQGERTGFSGVLGKALVLKASKEPAAGGAADGVTPRLPVDFVAMAK